MATPGVTNVPPPKWAVFGFSNISSLLAKTDRTFWLYAAAFTAGALYCSSRLYEGYRSTFYGTYETILKCRALLVQAKEVRAGGGDGLSLLKECYTLLKSVRDCMSKNEPLADLAVLYVKTDPKISFRLIQKLPFPRLFETVKKMEQEHPNLGYAPFYEQAFEAHTTENKACTLENIKLSLEFATIFHRLKRGDLEGQAFMDAKRVFAQMRFRVNKIEALCALAQSAQERNCSEAAKHYAQEAQKLCTSDLEPQDLISARMLLAETYFALKDDPNTSKSLDKLSTLSQTTSIMPVIIPLVTLIDKLEKNPDTHAWFTFGQRQLSKADFFDQKFEAPSSQDLTIEDLLTKTKAVQLLEDPEQAKEAWNTTYTTIANFSESSGGFEIDSKFDNLEKLAGLCQELPGDVQRTTMHALEGLYDRWPTLGVLKNKSKIGRQVLHLYNSLKLEKEAKAFFAKYLADLKPGEVTETIFRLTDAVNDGFTLEQNKALLDAAEALIPKTQPIQDLQIKEMAHKYLLVGNWQKTVDYLKLSINRRATHHFTVAAIAAAALAVWCVSPIVGCVSLGSLCVVEQLYRRFR
jgi:hypothetical protein